nr:PAS domain S-box protein [Nitrospirales bacterium]
MDGINRTVRQRIFLLLVILTMACSAMAVVAITLLYQAAFDEERVRLREITQTQARLMEAVARFDAQFSVPDHPEGAQGATLSQIIEAHQFNKGFGETVETTLGRREGDFIVWILQHRHLDFDHPQPTPFAGNLAEPMRLALSGKSGTIVGLDYRGETVLAAYEPVTVLNLGLVSKIDLQEIRRPYIEAGVLTIVVGLGIIALGGFLLFRISHPIISQLEASEAHTRAIIAHAADGIITANESGTIETFNATAERIFWFKASEVIGKNLSSLMPKPESEHHPESLAHYLLTGDRHILGTRREVTAQRPDHSTFPLSLAVTEAQLSGRRVFIALVHDLTEEKIMDRRLTAQYAIARALAESKTIPHASQEILCAVCLSLGWQVGALWQLDHQTLELQCLEIWSDSPDQFAEFVAITKQTTFTKNQGLPGRVWESGQAAWITDVVHDQNFPRADVAAKEHLHAAFALPIQLGGVTYGVMEFFSYQIREPDAALLHQMSAVGNQFGQFFERIQAQEAIADLAKFTKENPYPVIRISREGRILYHNQPGEVFLADLKRGINQAPNVQWQHAIQDAFRRGGVQRQEITCHDRIFSVTLSVGIGTDYMNVYAQEITDQRKAEEALRRREEHFRQIQKLEAIGTLAGGIAHDFNNILTPLIGFTEMATKKAEEGKSVIANLQEVLKAGYRAKDLVRQILTFSRQGETEKKPILLQSVVEEAFQLLRASFPTTITLGMDLSSTAGPVLANPTQIHQVIMNLSTNAEFAMRGKAGSLDVTLQEVLIDDAMPHRPPGLPNGSYVRLAMTDFGQGIPSNLQTRIFDPFFTTKNVGEGS